MRENYLKDIEKKTEEFLSKIYPQPDYRKVNFDIKKSALIVTDMQEYFLNKESHAYIPASESILPNISALISFFKKHGRPVIYTRHINTNENAGMMSKWWKDIITEENYGELTGKLETGEAKIITKSQYDVFYKTELEEFLKSELAESVVITGVAAHLCCETTARSAFVRGYEVYFPADCTASFDEEFHISTLRNLSHGFAHIIKSSDLIKKTGNEKSI